MLCVRDVLCTANSLLRYIINMGVATEVQLFFHYISISVAVITNE